MAPEFHGAWGLILLQTLISSHCHSVPRNREDCEVRLRPGSKTRGGNEGCDFEGLASLQ